jgi:hypothetical protein
VVSAPPLPLLGERSPKGRVRGILSKTQVKNINEGEMLMVNSLFLAKALGLYMLIVGVAMVFDASRVRPIILEMLNNPSMIYLSAFIALILGILLVISHNIWVMGWQVIITIIAWIALIQGTLRVIFPQFIVAMSRRWVESNRAYYISGLVCLLIGLFLCYHGFFPA